MREMEREKEREKARGKEREKPKSLLKGQVQILAEFTYEHIFALITSNNYLLRSLFISQCNDFESTQDMQRIRQSLALLKSFYTSEHLLNMNIL